MDKNAELTLNALRIECAAAETGCVSLWHQTKDLIELVNDSSLSHRGTALMRESLLEASTKISEAMNLITPVKDLLEVIVPDPALAAVDGDADGVG